MLASVPPEGYAGCCEAIASMDLRDDLPAIAADTLVVAGGEDVATPPSHGEAIAAAVPRARLVVLPKPAHLAAVEDPDAVAELLLEHFKEART